MPPSNGTIVSAVPWNAITGSGCGSRHFGRNTSNPTPPTAANRRGVTQANEKAMAEPIDMPAA